MNEEKVFAWEITNHEDHAYLPFFSCKYDVIILTRKS